MNCARLMNSCVNLKKRFTSLRVSTEGVGICGTADGSRARTIESSVLPLWHLC